MKDSSQTAHKENEIKQSKISVRLIMGIILTLITYMVFMPASENDRMYQVVLLFPVIALLSGGYVFTYRGKKPGASKIIFILFTILSVLGIIAFIYLIGMAKAYSHWYEEFKCFK